VATHSEDRIEHAGTIVRECHSSATDQIFPSSFTPKASEKGTL